MNKQQVIREKAQIEKEVVGITKKPILLTKYGAVRERIAKEEKKNIHSIPRIKKVVITSCLGDYFRDKNKFNSIGADIMKIALQAPITIKAKESVSNFSLREGMPIAYKVTLRRNKMFDFILRLIYLAWMNNRNFTGILPASITGNQKGGYSLSVGLKDISVFPEIHKTLDKHIGVGITICTNATNADDCKKLLEGLDIPFVTDKKEKEEKEK